MNITAPRVAKTQRPAIEPGTTVLARSIAAPVIWLGPASNPAACETGETTEGIPTIRCSLAEVAPWARAYAMDPLPYTASPRRNPNQNMRGWNIALFIDGEFESWFRSKNVAMHTGRRLARIRAWQRKEAEAVAREAARAAKAAAKTTGTTDATAAAA